MKLPFKILSIAKYDDMQKSIDYLQKVIDEHRMDLIDKREENKNLLYNYEKIKDDYKELLRRFNKLLSEHNRLKKKIHASTQS